LARSDINAERQIERVGTEAAQLPPTLEPYDEAISTQAAWLCQATGRDVRDLAFAKQLKTTAELVRRGFAAFVPVLPLG